jgi:hypothetical protein
MTELLVAMGPIAGVVAETRSGITANWQMPFRPVLPGQLAEELMEIVIVLENEWTV